MAKIRFKYGGGWHAAEVDARTFRKWEDGILDTFEAAYEVAKNNGLRTVSLFDFVETAHSLGYWRRGGSEDYGGTEKAE